MDPQKENSWQLVFIIFGSTNLYTIGPFQDTSCLRELENQVNEHLEKNGYICFLDHDFLGV